MRRFTEKILGRNAIVVKRSSLTTSWYPGSDVVYLICEAADRLAEYEKTGLSPEEMRVFIKREIYKE